MRKAPALILASLWFAVAAQVSVADTATTKPAAPPALASKLSYLPANIWIASDSQAPSKWGWEPDRIRWCMQQFPEKKFTYGEDTFSGTVLKNIGLVNPTDTHRPPIYMIDITTDTYTICGRRIKFLVSVFSPTPFTETDGASFTAAGPAQFWDFQTFTKNTKADPQDVRVVIHPELARFAYPAPIVLKSMGARP